MTTQGRKGNDMPDRCSVSESYFRHIAHSTSPLHRDESSEGVCPRNVAAPERRPFCPSCLADITGTERYCESCGKRLTVGD